MGIFTPFSRMFQRQRSKDVAGGPTGTFISDLLSNYRSSDSPRSSQSNMATYLGKYADQAWIYSCIKIIQSKGAGVPLKVYKLGSDGEDLEEQKAHPLKKLLDSVNPFMNGYDLLESTHGYIELVGNAYWLLDAIIAGKPTEIYPLNPKCIKILADKTRNVTGYSYEVIPGSEAQRFEPEEVIHFKTWNPLDDFYGLAPICAARDSSDMMTFSDQYNKAFFRNGAEPGGVLTSDQTIDDDVFARISAAWKKTHQGTNKAHKVAVLDGGMKFQSTAATHKDMEFTELKRMTREDVLTVFNMPPIMVGVFDEANYSNAREQRRIFWIDCMIPRLRKIESVLNERLAKPYDASLILKYDLSGVEELADDADTRSRSDAYNVQAGIMTVNEIRRLKNLEDVPWGDTWYAPLGLSPISDNSSPPKPEPADNPPPPPPANEGGGSDEEPAPTKTIKSEPAASDPIGQPVDQQRVRRDQIWVRYKGFTDKHEKKWSVTMRGHFNDQEREVIHNLEASGWQKIVNQNKLEKGGPRTKQSIDLIIFDRVRARTIFRRDANRLTTETVKESADKEIRDYSLGIDFNLTDPNVTSWIHSKAFKFADDVNATTEAALRTELAEAIDAGETIREVEDRIADVFDIARGSRTAMIARTEVISASNEGAYASYKQSGVVEKSEWITSRDNRVRDEHQIDGETVDLDDYFSNGLRYPGDPDGEPGNVINCRCTIAPVTSDEES